MAGTGKCNKFSGDSRRGTSYFIIKHIENKNLDTTMKPHCANTEEQIVSISHVDNAGQMTNGEDDAEKCKKALTCVMITMVLLVVK